MLWGKLIERRTTELLGCWQISLSSDLLHGRLDMLARAWAWLNLLVMQAALHCEAGRRAAIHTTAAARRPLLYNDENSSG